MTLEKFELDQRIVLLSTAFGQFLLNVESACPYSIYPFKERSGILEIRYFRSESFFRIMISKPLFHIFIVVHSVVLQEPCIIEF